MVNVPVHGEVVDIEIMYELLNCAKNADTSYKAWFNLESDAENLENMSCMAQKDLAARKDALERSHFYMMQVIKRGLNQIANYVLDSNDVLGNLPALGRSYHDEIASTSREVYRIHNHRLLSAVNFTIPQQLNMNKINQIVLSILNVNLSGKSLYRAETTVKKFENMGILERHYCRVSEEGLKMMQLSLVRRKQLVKRERDGLVELIVDMVDGMHNVPDLDEAGNRT